MKQRRRTTNLLAVALLLLMALLLLAMPRVTGVSLAWPNPGATPTPETLLSAAFNKADDRRAYADDEIPSFNLSLDSALSGDEWCCGYHDPGNPYNCNCGGDTGNCIWWASYRRPDLGDDNWGMPYEYDYEKGEYRYRWADEAEDDGFPVDTTPRIGDIAVYPPGRCGSTNGHVAYVTGLPDPNGNYTVTEMNCGIHCERSWSYNLSWCSAKFIHHKDGVWLYEAAWYDGRAERFTGNDGNLGDNPIGDNTVSSIQIQGNYWAILFEHPNYGGRYEVFGSSDPYLPDNYIGNDSVSSILVGQGSPPSDGVWLYQAAYYEGQSERFTGNDTDLGNNPVGDNTVSSIRIQGNYWAILFEHPNYGGRYEVFTSSDPYLPDNYIGNDSVSSILVGQGSPPSDGVWLYQAAYYEGQSERFTSNDTDLGNNPVGDNTVSSIRIQGNYWAILFEHTNYEGRCEIFGSSDTNLTDNYIQNDSASSIQVGPPPPTPPPCETATPTPTSTSTATPTSTNTPTSTPTATPTPTTTPTPSDTTPPTGEIISPPPDSYINGDQVDIVATASDDRSGVVGLQFFVWYDDGSGYDWHGLPLDWDGSDGWTSVWDTSGVADQGSIGFWTYIFDRAGNMGHYSHGGITLDRIPPCVLLGDFTCDCDVDVQDIQQVASRWRMTDTDPDWDAHYDLNGDGIITVVDIMKVSAHWGDTCESLAATLRPSGVEIEGPTQPPIPKSIP